MAGYATEAGVREKFQLNDTVRVPSSLVEQCIEEAHVEVLRELEPAFASESPETAIVMGETALAGARLYRSLAAKDAFDQKQVTIGGQRVDAGRRFDSLRAVAALCEENAWYLLAPYLRARPVRRVADASDSAPILGEA